MSRPRVLVITPDYPPAKGGIQILVHEVVNGFTQLDATVVTLDAPGSPPDDDHSDVPVRRVRQTPVLRSLSVAGLNGAAVDTARKLRPHAVLSAHIVGAPAAAMLRRWAGVPFLQYLHAKEVGARPTLARFAVTRAEAVVAVSHYTRELALSAGANPDRIHLIHPGVKPPSAAERENGDRPTVLTIARLEDRYKGHDVMLRALPLLRARIPDVQWVVIGDGPLRPALEDLAQASGVTDAVRFCGLVSDAERDYWLRRANAFVMVSRLPAGGYAGEGFGIVYLEANAHGVPTVAGNVGGAVDAVADGMTGMLVDPTNHVELADTLMRLLTDDAMARRLGDAGAARSRRFTWRGVSQQVEALLLDLAMRRR